MKKILLAVLLLATFIVSGCSAESQPADKAPAAATAHTAPDFNFTYLDGTQSNLAKLQGKPVFLNFWATWCPPCVGEMPHFETLYPKYKDKITFIAVSVDDNAADAKQFVVQRNFSFPVAHADAQDIMQKYNIPGIPASYLLDADGKIIVSVIGAMNQQTLEKFLQQSL